MLSKDNIMDNCIKQARRAKGYTLTNPLVGAAVVYNDNIIYGIHEEYGKAHAEVNAIDKAGSNAFGAELYVTLEPCSTTGKTPPCVDKIISAGIKKVYVGVLDPNPKHAGKAVKLLKDAGINVEVGINSLECALLIEDFIKSQTCNMPYITLKTAVSADGRIGSKVGDSKWITCDLSRELVHKMRSETDVVLTGIGTVLADNPMLNDRRACAVKQPARAVVDRTCKIDLNCNIVQTADHIKTILFVSNDYNNKDKISKLIDKGIIIEKILEDEYGKIDLNQVLKTLHNYNFMNVMVEAGSGMNGALFDSHLVDRLEQFIAPKIIGGKNAMAMVAGLGVEKMSDALEFVSYTFNQVGKDIHISARMKDYATNLVDFTMNFR